MTNCQEFKQWLNSQDDEDRDALRQVKDHIQICQTCEKLYHADMELNTKLSEGMQAVEPPPGLIDRARHKIESESRPLPFRFLKVSWKATAPALTMAALMLVILLNPFSGQLQTVDEVVAHSIANHLDTGMKMAFRVGDISDVGQWFTQHLGFKVLLPDLEKLGLILLGGRKCALGKIDAALLFCKSKGKRASLFMMDHNDVDLRFDNDRQYIVTEGDLKVTV